MKDRADILTDEALHQRPLHSVNITLKCKGMELATETEYKIYTQENAKKMREYYK
jgi:hypothetical protein